MRIFTVSPVAHSLLLTKSEQDTTVFLSFISLILARKIHGLFNGVGSRNFTNKEPVAYAITGVVLSSRPSALYAAEAAAFKQ